MKYRYSEWGEYSDYSLFFLAQTIETIKQET